MTWHIEALQSQKSASALLQPRIHSRKQYSFTSHPQNEVGQSEKITIPAILTLYLPLKIVYHEVYRVLNTCTIRVNFVQATNVTWHIHVICDTLMIHFLTAQY